MRPSFADATRALLRERAFDAAAQLLRERRWADITMADIARGAGVSRQTLYNEFGSRDEFAQGFVLREADVFVDAVGQVVARHPDDPRGAVAAAFDLFLSAARDDPFVRAIATGDGGDGLLALVTTHGGPVIEHATERLASVIAATWPDVPAEPASVVAEVVVRLAISHAAQPSGPADLTAQTVAGVLGPYIDEVLGA